MCLVTEWLIVAFSLEFAFLFWLRVRKDKKEKLKSLQEKAYIILFISYGISYVFYIIGDYYLDSSFRRLFYDSAYLILMGGGLMFIKIIENYRVFIKKNFFTIFFGVMILIFVLVLIFAHAMAQSITIFYYPVFFVFFLFYLRALFTDVYRKRKLKGFKKDVANIAMGFLCLFVGYNLATDMSIDIFGGIWIRAFGNILQLIAFIFIFIFLVLSPSFAEFDWQEKIDSIYVTNKAGLFIYEKNFRENQDPGDQNVIAGLLTGVKVMVQKLTHRGGISFIEKKGKIIIINPKSLVTGIIICDSRLKSLCWLLNNFLERVEESYANVLQDWDGDLNIFQPIENITKGIFLS